MQPEYVRRNPNGSIDYDFYRRRAARLRADKFSHSVRATMAMVRPLIAIALLVGTVLALPTRGPEAPTRPLDVAAATAAGSVPRAE
jgi:hypothetical protein